MRLRLKQHVAQAWSLTVMLYTSGPRKGWRHNLWHLIVCFTISIIFTAFLFIGLRMSQNFHTVVSGGIAGVCMLMVTAALFFSKHVRCFSILFLISSGMNQGRNLLICVGTGLVVFWIIKNTFSNLTELSRSLICNSVELFEKECLFEPKLLIHQSVVPLCVITIILITLVLLSAKLAQLRLLVTDLFYMDNAEERVRHLHTKILRKRTKLKAPQSANTALFKKTSFWFPVFMRNQKEDFR